MKNFASLSFVLFVLVACAHQEPKVDFLYKGMNTKLMLNVMGEPLQIVDTYQGTGSNATKAKQYQFSNDKCIGGSKNVCTVSVTTSGIVYGWQDVKRPYTEDGQR